VTYNASQPARSTGAGADVKTFATAVLLTFGVGLLGLLGYGILDSGFGGFLGLVAGVFGIVWWVKIHGKAFPAVIPGRSLLILFVADILLSGGLVLLSR
jgi:hypothetical protein